MVRLAEVGPGARVVEIGAGCGNLTVALARSGCRVLAIETDRRLIETLEEMTQNLSVRVIHADARDLDSWKHLLASSADAFGERSKSKTEGSWNLVSNLPYNIAVRLLLDILDECPDIEKMLVMLQRETAQRLTARPGEANFGLPSLKVSYWATAEMLGRVPPSVFLPRPRVDSAILRINRRVSPAVNVPIAEIYQLAGTAFTRRRKMLRHSLSGLLDKAAFSKAGVDPTARPEELHLSDWARLLRELKTP